MAEKKEELKENKKEEVKVEKAKENKKEEVKAEKTKENKKEEVKAKKEEVKTPKTDNKKFEVKTGKTKKIKNNTKKTKWIVSSITVIAVLIIVALLTFMIVTSSDPKKSIDGFLTNLKAGDFEKAQEFMTGEGLLEEEQFNMETKKLLFDKIAWKITKITKENEKATVELEVTNKDFQTIMSNCMKKVMEDFRAILEGNSIEQNMEKYFEEELKNEEVQTTTATKTIQLVKENKKWKIVSNEELVDALLPGLQETINSLN